MKYKKVFHGQKEPHFLSVLFPTILPYDWLTVIWYFVTFRARKAIKRINGILVLIELNKIGRNEFLVDYYSLRDMTQADIMTEKYILASIINEAEKDERNKSI